MVFAVVVGVALRINGTTSVNAFFYMGTIGVLSMLIAYIVTNLGAMRFLHLGRREAAWRVIVPILAIAALVYTLYKNLWPRPPHPYNLFPYFVAGWLVLGIAITLVFPGLAHRIGRNLSRAEGIDTPPGDPKG
jgi:amino acid transporter